MGHLLQTFSLIFNLHDYENKTQQTKTFTIIKMWFNKSKTVATFSDCSQT